MSAGKHVICYLLSVKNGIDRIQSWLARIPVAGSGSDVPIRGSVYLYTFSPLLHG